MDSGGDTCRTSESEELNSSSESSTAAGSTSESKQHTTDESFSTAASVAATTNSSSSSCTVEQMSSNKDSVASEDQQQRQQYQEAMAAQMRYLQQQNQAAAGNGGSTEQAMMMMPGMMPFMMSPYQMMMQQHQGGGASSGGFMSQSHGSGSSREPDQPTTGSPLNLQTSGRGSADPISARRQGDSLSSTPAAGGFPPHSMEQQIRPAHQGNDLRQQRSSPGSGSEGGGSQQHISGGQQPPHSAHLHNPHQGMHHHTGGSGGSSTSEGGSYGSHPGSGGGGMMGHSPANSNVSSASGSKPDIPAPPKRPLTPYMRFSKLMWQQVKSSNPGMSVCEIGATIGRLWRELSNEEKQRHNDDFTLDKARYDTELKSYLKTTGLHASDLVKKPKKKEPPKSAPPKRLLPPTSTSTPSRPSPSPSNSGSSNLLIDNHHQQQQQQQQAAAAAAAAAAHQQAMQQQQLAQSFMGLPISSMAAGTLPMGMPMGMLTGFPQMWAAQQYGGLNMAAASGLQLAHHQAAAHHDLYAAGMASNGQPHGESAGPMDPSHMAQMYLHSQNFM